MESKKLTQEQIAKILEGVNGYYNTKKYVTFYHIIDVIIDKKEEKLLYVRNNFNQTRNLYIIDEDKVEMITNRVNNIVENISESKVNMSNYNHIKEQTKKVINGEGTTLNHGIYTKDVAYKGFMVQQTIYCRYSKLQKKDTFVSVLPNKKVINTWFNFLLFSRLKELKNIWNREDVIIFNDTEEEVINVDTAIEKVLGGDTVEIHYLSHGETKDNVIAQFSNFWYVGGDLYALDDFVYCEDEDRLIDSYDAVWCEDVCDFRHIDDIYTDFEGETYGSDEHLIYSEEKEYYIYETKAVKIYTDTDGNYFWVHCEDLEDYYYHEYDERY